ncbi:Glycosidase [Carnobacterium iners]|uniref:Glycosidase n=1 Tax=Carnobacterium iners TaxID=1073423 RepID=A0A1X7N5C4_9LACT|nr:glycoside hydrolase family 13 protein [Carnobacterium iners]SEK43575.1 Glycosidase [Carnobacterium iners]SMH32563.1 Glycosidase [Carnobacterium iners]
MEKITYHSWKEEYKSPFGAVKIGSDIQFQLDCQLDGIETIYLIIHKDFGESFQIEMTPINQIRFKTVFTTSNGSGLYFYHFKIEYQENSHVRTIYYGNNQCNLGGKGIVYYEKEDIKQYQLTSYLFDDPAPGWYQNGVAYQLFVDRFYNGNENGEIKECKKNSFIYATQEDLPLYIKNEAGEIIRWEFFGGNLLGIIKKLPYLVELGITILYLNPIFEARSNHKYDTADFMKIDPMFGDEAQFRELIAQSEKVGIKIILDGVFNHVGADSRYFNQFDTYPSLGAYQSLESPYKDWFIFNHFPTDFRSWWGIKDLPTLNKENKKVKEFIYANDESVIQYWSKMGIGGWRIDVADELSDDFLLGIRRGMDKSAADLVLIGEVWEDATNKIAYGERRHYLEGGIMHGVMNYPFRDIIIRLLDNLTTTQEAVFMCMNLKENYPPEALKNNLNNIGSHDTTRIFTALQSNSEKVKQALVLLFVLPGVPCIYYGDEVGVEGGMDPDNRRQYPWGNENKDTQSVVKQLIALRKNQKALVEGSFYSFSTHYLFMVLRYLSDEEYVLVLINSTEKEQEFKPKDILSDHHFDYKSFFKRQAIENQIISAQGIKIVKSSQY